jgi:D-alanyl-D-alanine carboxypeptidase (penicillin-binding protein 5/6)
MFTPVIRLVGVAVLAAASLLAPALTTPARAQAFETTATAAWVYDQTTGTVLLDKNADMPLPPASMSKLMTIYMAFEAVAEGRLLPDQTLGVSEHAVSFRGSTMFLDTTDRVSVEDLLRGVIVLSGNDASVVLAEAMSPDGTEAGFAEIMTARARELGMMNSHFVNASGWPAQGHVMTMHDLGILADHLIRDFPTFYPLFAETEFNFDNRAPANTENRNPILEMELGPDIIADGLKTGHTQEAGYGLVGSAKQGDRRIIFVITGLETEQQRRDEAERIVTWAFRQYALRDVGEAGTRVAEADVWMGAAPTVGLTLAEDLSILVPTVAGGGIEAAVTFASPVSAPVVAGQPMGELVITRDDLPEVRVPLVAEAAVAEGGFMVRVQTTLMILIDRFITGSTASDGAA